MAKRMKKYFLQKTPIVNKLYLKTRQESTRAAILNLEN